MSQAAHRHHAPNRSAAFWADDQLAAQAAWYVPDPRRTRRANRWPRAILWCAVLLMSAWVIVATGYLMLTDDPHTVATGEKSQLRAAYEDRISRLRQEIDEINGRLMLNQDSFNSELEGLRQRQRQLEARQGLLNGLLDEANHPAIQSLVEPATDGATGSLPGKNSSAATPGSGREIRLVFAPKDSDAPTSFRLASAGGAAPAARNQAEHALSILAESQDRLEARQNAMLAMLEARAVASSQAYQDIIAELGFDPDQVTQGVDGRSSGISVGGPFVPVLLDATDARSRFERRIAQVRQRIAISAGLYDGLITLPVRRPLQDDGGITSGFGTRRDPFLGRMAMHAGIDFRASTGTPVYATADGIVTGAGRNGGYGRMVDIRHDNGISTRYGHLSRIDVSEGDRVKAGDVIGLVGSTGRSTGPHLHYETRINGEAVDAGRFIRAGDKFFEKLLN